MKNSTLAYLTTWCVALLIVLGTILYVRAEISATFGEREVSANYPVEVVNIPASEAAAQRFEYEQQAVREEQKEADASTAEPIMMLPENGRYAALNLGAEDIELIARVVWQEARGESLAGQQAVVEVILNRVMSPLFPNTVYEVVYQENPRQFDSAPYLMETVAEAPQYQAVSNALSGPAIVPIDVLYFATTPITSDVWGSIGGHVFCYQPGRSA